MSRIEHSVTPEAGKFDFDGACAPHGTMSFGTYTFTLGIFQWVAKKDFSGRPNNQLKPNQLKRGKVFQRLQGATGKPQPTYDEARRLCAGYNDGSLIPPTGATT